MTRRDNGKIIVIIGTVKYLMKSLEITVKKLRVIRVESAEKKFRLLMNSSVFLNGL